MQHNLSVNTDAQMRPLPSVAPCFAPVNGSHKRTSNGGAGRLASSTYSHSGGLKPHP